MYLFLKCFTMFIFGILANPTFVNRFCVLNVFGYICVGTRNIYEAQLFPTLIIDKKLIFFNLPLYLYVQYRVYVRCCFHITCSAQTCFMTSVFLNLHRDMPSCCF